MNSVKIIILAGGKGSRLWPLSTEEAPKQFLKLENDLSLLQNTVKRFIPYFPLSNLFIATTKEYQALTEQHLIELDPSFTSRIFLEPCSKNTSFAITWAIKQLKEFNDLKPSDLILITPIDHVFSDSSLFMEEILLAIASYGHDHLLSFGILAQKADPLLGYLQKGALLSNHYYKALSFIEKPDHQLASKLYEEGWLWNVGLYLFSLSVFEKELKLHAPIFYKLLNDNDFKTDLLPSISIDHALIKKTKHLTIFHLYNLCWLDIGSWNSLELYLKNQKSLLYEINLSS